jgi:hypothetical protein
MASLGMEDLTEEQQFEIIPHVWAIFYYNNIK